MFSFNVASVDLRQRRFSKKRKEANRKAMPCYQRPVIVPSDWLVAMVLPCYWRPGRVPSDWLVGMVLPCYWRPVMGFFLNLFKRKTIFSHFT